jgi:hypothetical protein
MTNRKPAARTPSRQMTGSEKPEILVGHWSPEERKADLGRRKARRLPVPKTVKQAVAPGRAGFQQEPVRLKSWNEAQRAKEAVAPARLELQTEIDRLSAENEALRAKQAVAHAPPALREEIDRLTAENEALRKQRKVPKARKSKAGRVRKKKRKRGLHPKPRVISTPMGGQPRFRR